ncbi:MAG: hypothetical protein M1827_003904 [Pycnora praestabilis]|nr:MAG: hypothetical protein M1827_003904 [Pycnora praestabilis]
MPRRRSELSISSLIESQSDRDDSASDEDMTLTADSGAENVMPTTKTRGRSKANSKQVSRTTSRRTSGASALSDKKTRPMKGVKSRQRPALKERSNEQEASDTEEVDDFDDNKAVIAVHKASREPTNDGAMKAQAKRGRGVQSKVDTVARGRKKASADSDSSKTVSADAQQLHLPEQTSTETKKTSSNRRQPSARPEGCERVIPETQVSPMDIDQTVVPEEDEPGGKPSPHPSARHANHLRSKSKQRQPSAARKRAGSASDNECVGNDPTLRRKLGEITKKFENLDLKYQTLREVVVKEAESNFEKLKKQTEQRSKAANDLIASLKKEVVTQTALAQESRSFQKQLASQELEFTKLQSKRSQLSSSLLEAQNEIKSLNAKLAALRTSATKVQSVDGKVPGSAVKSNGQTRTIMIGSAEVAQTAKLKEDLYSDLTGLILRNVVRSEESDIYDCIQTGRNGTLHFKLAVYNDIDGKGSGYEDTEFQYTPLLDSNRDKELLELLPDYLTEEITFSRLNAAKFYGRVVETLTKKHVED